MRIQFVNFIKKNYKYFNLIIQLITNKLRMFKLILDDIKYI